MSELIFEDGCLHIRAGESPSDELVSLLARTAWGSGGTRYRINDVPEKLALLAAPEFLTLRMGERLAGVYVFCRKQVAIGAHTYPAYYRTFLAVDPELSARGLGRCLVDVARERYRRALGGAGLLYGYIEADNTRSLRVSQLAGYERIATFRCAVFSRLRPQRHEGFRRLRVDEKRAAVANLDALYHDHNLRDFAESLEAERYFVLEDEAGIAAGVQSESCDWVIESLPGLSGFLLVNVVSRAPGLRRLFDARRCRFLKFANLYARPGCEAALFALMESVLADQGVGCAMILHDPRSPVFRRFEASGSLGMLNAAVDARVHVMAEHAGLPPADHRHLMEHPIVLSPLDVG